jgi:hypothetical protein
MLSLSKEFVNAGKVETVATILADLRERDVALGKRG